MANTTKRLLTKGNHTTATKLEAVNKVRRLIRGGMSKNAALKVVAGPLHRKAQSIQNWMDKYENLTTSTNNTSLIQSAVVHDNHTGRFTVKSIDLRTVNGVDITLTLKDIHEIAYYAGFTS